MILTLIRLSLEEIVRVNVRELCHTPGETSRKLFCFSLISLVLAQGFHVLFGGNLSWLPEWLILIGVHASQSGALLVALQPEKREYFRGTEPTIYQPKAAPGPLYIPGTQTRMPADPVTYEHICD